MKKLTLDHVKNYIESFGYTLLSGEYVSAQTPLLVQCDKKHDPYYVRYYNFQQGKRCPHCAGNIKKEKTKTVTNCKNIKLTYEYVKTFIENLNYKLLSNEYVNKSTKLHILCDKNHDFYMTFGNLKHGNQRCPYCSKNKRKTFEEVKNIIESEHGYKLLSTEFLNTIKKLDIQCPSSHIFHMSYNTWSNTPNRCSYCAGNTKLTQIQVETIFSNEGYIFDDEYENIGKKYNIICPKNHKFKTRVDHFRGGGRCKKCTGINQSIDEKNVLNFVKSIYDKKIIENSKTTIRNPLTGKWLELDIYLPDLHKAIEFNGTYWHSLLNVKNRDEIKKQQCMINNIDLLIIEESNWKNKKNDCLKELRNFINR